MAQGKIKIWYLLALLVVVGMLVFAIAGFLFLQKRRDPQQYVKKADLLTSQGKHEEAVRQFEKAAYYDSNDINVITGWAEALEKTPPAPPQKAERNMMKLFGLWRKIATFEEASDETIEKILKSMYRLAEKTSDMGTYNNLYSLSNELREDRPDSDLIKRYRALAVVGMMRHGNIGQQQMDKGREDLEALLEKNPQDPELNTAFGFWHLYQAARAARLNDAMGRATHALEAVKILENNSENNPDNLRGLEALAIAYLQTKQREKALEKLAQIEEKLLTATDAPAEFVKQFSRLVSVLDNEPAANREGNLTSSGLIRAETVLTKRLENHPDDLLCKLELAMTIKHQNRLDAAAERLREVIQFDNPVPISEDAILIPNLKTTAKVELANILLASAENTQDQDTRNELISEIRNTIDGLPRNINTSGITDIIEGKIAILQGDLQKAIQSLETADKKFGGRNPEAIFLSAVLLKRTGETGAAIERLNRLTSGISGGRALKIYRELVDAYIKANMIDKAEAAVNQMLTIRPNDEAALLLKSQIMIQQARKAERATEDPISETDSMFSAASNLLAPLAEAGNRSAQLQLAQIQLEEGNIEGARGILEKIVDKNPEDLMAFQRLIQLDLMTDNKEKAQERIRQAMEQNPDAKNVYELLLQKTLDGEQNISEKLQNLIKEEKDMDPFQSAMALYMVHRMEGDMEKAEEALATAEKINPDDPRIISIRFQRAIQQEDWAEAKAVADKAGEIDLDNAQGLFWQARLLVARNKLKEASDTLELALERRPLFSEGWRLQGDVYRMLGELIAAENAYQEAIHLNPNNASAWFNLHLVHEQRGYAQRALEDLQRARELMPRSERIYAAYLSFLSRHDKPAALAERIKIAEKNPEDMNNLRNIGMLYLETGNLDQARKVIGRLLKDDRKNLDNLLIAAMYFNNSGKFENGRKLLENNISDKGENATTQDYLALARYLREGDLVQPAIISYQKAVELADQNNTASLRELADWLFALETYDKSLPLYQKIMETDTSARVWLRLIENLVRLEKTKEADREIAKFAEKNGTDTRLALLRGLNALGSNNMKVAEDAFEEAVRLDPNNAQAYLYRARMRLMAGEKSQSDAARADLEKAVSLDNSLISAYDMLLEWHLNQNPPNVPDAIGTLKSMININPENISYKLRLANLLLVRDDFTELQNLLEDAIKGNPNMPIWYRIRAQVHLKENEEQKALVDLSRVYKMDPSAESLAPLAQLMIKQKSYAKVLDLFQNCPDKEVIAGSGPMTAIQAAALFGVGKTSEANAGFRRALTLSGNNPAQLNMVMNIMFDHLEATDAILFVDEAAIGDSSGIINFITAQVLYGKNKKAEAAQRLEMLRSQLLPNDANWGGIMRYLGNLYLETQQYPKAVEVYRAMIDQAPDDAIALNNLAYVYTDYMKDPKKGIPFAERAAEIAPDNSEIKASILDTLGYAYFLTGEIDRAQLTLDESIRVDPTMYNRFHMAKVLLAKGRHDRALSQLRMAKSDARQSENEDMLKQIEELMEEVYDKGGI
jgi:tetratricopeptide (TPR) repeat protein